MNIVFGQQGIMFSKGKGLFGMNSRPRRRGCKVSINYDDNHLWEDDAVYVGEKLGIHTARWQDPQVLEQWGIKEDFDTFTATTSLLGFAQNPQETYAELSREILSTFRFERRENYRQSKKSKEPSPTFVCKFTMKGERLILQWYWCGKHGELG